MSKVEGGGGAPIDSPLKASCNYFFQKASRVKISSLVLLCIFIVNLNSIVSLSTSSSAFRSCPRLLTTV